MWKKKLKGLFIEEETNSAPAPSPLKQREKEVATQRSKQPAAATPPSTSSAPAERPAPGGQIRDKFVKVLLEAMEGANLPGFDYLEYKRALKNLEKMNFTEEVMYQTAYAGAQSMGVEPAQLVSSAQHYLGVLEQEEKKFRAALENQRRQQVGDRMDQLSKMDKEIGRQEAQIKKLQADITARREKQAKLRAGVEQSTGKLAATEADFDRTFRTITEKIRADTTKMQQYLK